MGQDEMRLGVTMKTAALPNEAGKLPSLELYTEICNIVARSFYDIPDDDPMLHTSSEARKAASKILDLLDLEGA